MEAGTVEQVVDKLAEKIGVAAEKLAPVAEEALSQIRYRGIFHGCVGLLVLAAMIAVTRYSIKMSKGFYIKGEQKEKEEKSSDEEKFGFGLFIVMAIVAGVACIPAFCEAVSAFGKAIAPLAYVLGK